MSLSYLTPEFKVLRDYDKCINCKVCMRQCSFEVHSYDEHLDKMVSNDMNCVNCQRCVVLCPTQALTIIKHPQTFKEHANWTYDAIRDIYRQAETGGVLLSSMGNDRPYPVYWDKMVINASQVTNPSIDPLREPMELRVYIGRKPDKIEIDENLNVKTKMPPQLKLETPIMFSAMSYGSISYNAHAALARAAEELGILYNTGEGGLHKDFRKYGKNTIVQVASGRFGVDREYLNTAAAI